MPYSEMALRKRSWVPHSGWPITLEELQAYYKRALPRLGLDLYYFDEPFWRKATAQRYDPLLPFNDDLVQTRFWQHSVPATRFGEIYRNEIGASSNVEVVLNANVVELKATANAVTIDHVKIASLGGKKGKVRAHHYILACGGLENPRLLLNSNSVVSAGLGNERGQVGRYFMDHPGGECGIVFAETAAPIFNPMRTFHIMRENRMVLSPGACLAPAVMAREGLLEASVTLRQLSLVMIDGKKLNRLQMIVRSEQAPNPDSQVRLVTEKDELGLNRIATAWKMTEIDKRTFRRMGEVFGSEMARLKLGYGKVMEWVVDPNPDRWAGVLSSHHHLGTTRMSALPISGVVDKDCRVHGLANLFVAGSSVFPTSGVNNPTLTIVALAIRLADHLKKSLRL